MLSSAQRHAALSPATTCNPTAVYTFCPPTCRLPGNSRVTGCRVQSCSSTCSAATPGAKPVGAGDGICQDGGSVHHDTQGTGVQAVHGTGTTTQVLGSSTKSADHWCVNSRRRCSLLDDRCRPHALRQAVMPLEQPLEMSLTTSITPRSSPVSFLCSSVSPVQCRQCRTYSHVCCESVSARQCLTGPQGWACHPGWAAA
jgi:hypothetical protein